MLSLCFVFLGSLLCVVELVSNPGTGVLWVLTHPCDPPRQDGEPSERQLVLACLHVWWLLLPWLIVAIRLVYVTGLVRLCQKWNAVAAGYDNSFSTLPKVLVLEFQAFRNWLVLHFEMSHDQYNLQVSKRRSWLQMTSSARITILDPAPLIIVSSARHLGHISIQ